MKLRRRVCDLGVCVREVRVLALLAILFIGNQTFAAEPNETFAQATVLAAGVLSVDDDVAPGSASSPDTYLGTLGFFGNIEFTDDDNSEYGDGYASGLSFVPINPGGTIDFLVTGCCDSNFTGDHVYSGDYEVIVDVYDFFDDYLETITEIRTMEPGVVEEFNFFGDETWINGTYDINIDNTVGAAPSDVDFFAFTGLTPGASFSAEVTQETYDGFDSYLGWFSNTGLLLEFNDDNEINTLSLLEGTVPANGRLTFAVTGCCDAEFLGDHAEDATYSLELTLSGVSPLGDFDSDGDVDGRDFLRWQRGNSPNPLSATDLANWRNNYGTGGLGAFVAIPEPGTLVLIVAAACGLAINRPALSRQRLSGA